MKLFGYEIRRIPPPKPALDEQLIEAAEEMTELWSQSRQQKLGLSPWIDWETKEIYITEFTRNKK